MKKFTLGFLLLFFASLTFAQDDCEAVYPLTEGTLIEMTSYNAKGKADGRTEQHFNKVYNNGEEVKAMVTMKHFDKKDEEVMTNEYEMICRGDKFYVDMKSMMNGETFAAYENMEIEVDADELEIPMDGAAGSSLPDADLHVKVMGPFVMNITMHVVNRKIEGREEITTPAGTFDCLKISQTIKSKVVMANVEVNSVDWYAKGAGAVRTESYKKNGKLAGYTELTKLEVK